MTDERARELVEALRELARRRETYSIEAGQAADEIERLRAEVRTLREENARLAPAGASGFEPRELDLLGPPPFTDLDHRPIYEALARAGRARDLNAVQVIVDTADKHGMLTHAVWMQVLRTLQAMRKWAELLATIDALPPLVVGACSHEVEMRRRIAQRMMPGEKT